MRRLILAAAVATVLAPTAAGAADADNGKQLYRAFCAQCHGLDGTGKGVNAATMDVEPRDHTDSREMGARTDADLFKAIKEGGPAINKSVLMPNWDATLTDAQIHDVVAYLRVLSNTESK